MDVLVLFFLQKMQKMQNQNFMQKPAKISRKNFFEKHNFKKIDCEKFRNLFLRFLRLIIQSNHRNNNQNRANNFGNTKR